MTFGDAIEALKVGHRVSRTGWIENKVWIELRDCHGDAPYFLAVYDGEVSMWPAPHDDLLAEDWFVPEFMTAHTDDAGRF